MFLEGVDFRAIGAKSHALHPTTRSRNLTETEVR
jgi:hypothetical protein